MQVKIITAHPREDSLTTSVVENFTKGLKESGHEFEVFDLYQERFNPILFPEDEPDFENPNKVYSGSHARNR
ncbi:NAD(P)H-dependent oxidoreductase [Salicibibacter kimchii]|nr:NAD(P)H-dependent oxidoreductase [Salicibibacter kimchii]